MVYFIGWYADRKSGEVFPYRLLEKLAHDGIDLALDVYGELGPATG
ncbi:MAG TPA: hypothetical protein VIJ28_14480 [Chloroflexota bacterium]|jgi:hypothetical protein